jgi:DNA-binding PadR family transcriptional regulator
MGKKFISRSEEYIMLAVMHLQDEAYGVAIRHHLKKITGKAWAFGAIHVMLTRLEKKKLLGSQLADPTPQRGGRRKRIYTITSAGRETLEEIKKIQDKVWSGIPGILTEK